MEMMAKIMAKMPNTAYGKESFWFSMQAFESAITDGQLTINKGNGCVKTGQGVTPYYINLPLIGAKEADE